MTSRFEIDNTVQFTWQSSVQPDSAPVFSVREEIGQTVVASFTSLQSGPLAYYALYTIPSSEGMYYTGEWRAQKTVSGSARLFVSRFGFKGERTDIPST